MVKGVGIDLVNASRFKENIPENVFSESELAESNNDPVKLAERFAVKEAVCKAYKVGILSVDIREIVLQHNIYGDPFAQIGFNLFNKETDSYKRYEYQRCHDVEISLSHEKVGNDILVTAIAILSYNPDGYYK